jgi:hypothetical protein
MRPHALPVSGAGPAPAVIQPSPTGAPTPSSLGLLLVADAQDAAGSDLFGFGFLLHVDFLASAFVLGLDATSDVDGYGVAPLPIGSVPSLAGATVYAQSLWLWLACAPSPLHPSMSRGLAITFQ